MAARPQSPVPAVFWATTCVTASAGVDGGVEIDARNIRVAGDPCDLGRTRAQGDGVDEPEVPDALGPDERNLVARAPRLTVQGGDQSGGVTREARRVHLVAQRDQNRHLLGDTGGRQTRLQRDRHVGVCDRRNEAQCKRACGCQCGPRPTSGNLPHALSDRLGEGPASSPRGGNPPGVVPPG